MEIQRVKIYIKFLPFSFSPWSMAWQERMLAWSGLPQESYLSQELSPPQLEPVVNTNSIQIHILEY